ncbi:ABC transporter substrate-binding protein [Prevotella sp. oral taxon 317]|uniref:ABC transporter substrate-binding protein n=1 Tax=Prevotella sp. oral taxon 317 TaxID=652721 RepID=UPI0001C3FE5C|nr:ABC transporter substrate-binding protein [Prevotella sp. oral taxon 317]EFC69694.1 hypothetical protein HMPREF0670_01017 [Prevotella sp. oral taxon 317 str. F0108]
MTLFHIRTLALATLTTLLFACNGKGNAPQNQSERQTTNDSTLRIAVMPTLDCLPLYVADATGMFGEEHINVRLMKYTAQMDCDTAILRGRVQGVFTDLVRAQRLRQKGVNLHEVGATNLHWQLISNRNARLKDVRQLGDKMVGMTRFSATDFLTADLIDRSKPKNEVFRIQVNNVFIRLKMLVGYEIDAAFMPEPQATVARMGKNNVLADTKAKDIRLGVAVFSMAAKDQKKVCQALPAFVKAYDRACDSLNIRGIQHYADLLKAHFQLNDAAVKALPKTAFAKMSPVREKDRNAIKDFPTQ